MSNGAEVVAAVAIAAVVGAAFLVVPRMKGEAPARALETASDAERVDALQIKIQALVTEQRRLTEHVATIAAGAKAKRDALSEGSTK